MARATRGDGDRTTSPSTRLLAAERRTLVLLGVPTFAFALSITVVTTYLPLRLERGMISPTVIGLLIGAEGLMALWVPLLAGAWSDRLRTSLGGRLPFIVAGTPLMAAALVVLGFVPGVTAAAIVLAVFFGAYYFAYEPYRALYPDLVSDRIAGRAQSTQAVFRGIGTFLALLGGGLLAALALAAPFVAAAVVLVVAIGVFVVREARHRPEARERPASAGLLADARAVAALLRRRELRLYLAANSLWELSLAALKTFVLLYLTRGLGLPLAGASLAIGAAALLILAGAGASGAIADRLGRTRVLRWGLVVYGVGLLVPFLVSLKALVACAAALIALGGGVVMALPYAVLMPLMTVRDHGAVTGFYGFSRGIGVGLGPLLAGAAVAGGTSIFPSTHGYQAVWGVCAAAVLASLVPLARLRAATGEE